MMMMMMLDPLCASGLLRSTLGAEGETRTRDLLIAIAGHYAMKRHMKVDIHNIQGRYPQQGEHTGWPKKSKPLSRIIIKSY